MAKTVNLFEGGGLNRLLRIEAIERPNKLVHYSLDGIDEKGTGFTHVRDEIPEVQVGDVVLINDRCADGSITMVFRDGMQIWPQTDEKVARINEIIQEHRRAGLLS